MNPESEPRSERVLIQVGHYLRSDQAEERGLALLAMGLAYWIIPTDGFFSLFVNAADASAAAEELEKYEAERRLERKSAAEEIREHGYPSAKTKIPATSLIVFCWIMIGYFAVQMFAGDGPQGRGYNPAGWTARGVADSHAILQGQWWRALTALTLHGDLGHLVANLGVGVIFAGALLRFLGVGWTWLGIVLSGVIGNLLNAWGHRGDAHASIGASTAVFGGLGMLVGLQLHAAIRNRWTHREPSRARFRDTLFPIGAGLALLAYLGTGTETGRVDVMAHLLGMISGAGIGLFLAWSQLPRRTGGAMQKLLAAVAMLLPILGWALAYLHDR